MVQLDEHAMKDVVVGFARGERPFSDLQRAGIPVKVAGKGLTFSARTPTLPPVSMLDVALGLMHYSAHPEGRRLWGLGLEGVLELADEFENDSRGEILLDAIWDASFLNAVNPKHLDVAREIIQTERMSEGG